MHKENPCLKANPHSRLQTIPVFLWGWVLTVGLLVGCSSGGGDVALPLPPTGIIASAGDDQATITWNPVAGATSYKLYMNTQPGISLTNPANMHHPSVTSPFVHTNLVNGTTYYFVMTAVNKNGESVASSEVSATPQALSLPVITLTATLSSITSGETSTLSWSSTNSTSCISTDGGGTGITGTFTTPALTATTTYTVTCTGAGGAASQSATVTVAGALTQFGSVPAAGVDPGNCVLDSTTGLMWEVKTTDGGLRDWNKFYTNYDSTTSAQKWNNPADPNPTQVEIDAPTNSVGFKNMVNAQVMCGFNDWRLPTLAELQSIVKTGSQPSIDTAWFPNTQPHFYWSTSPAVYVASGSFKAWGVDFFNRNGSGFITYRYIINSVRLVRTAQ